MITPLRFRPYLRPTVWGGRRLGEVLGKDLPTTERYGESWEISDHDSHHSVVIGGETTGWTLHELMQRDPVALLGRTERTFPWLVKYLDACDWLSVQVHPDERTVGRLWPGEGSKTEAWFVLSAQPGSRIYAGLLAGVDEQILRKALAARKVTECLHCFEPKAGDCLFLPAGTIHAVGGGVLIAEVQQTSDATFRLFDWNRRDSQGKTRPLHVEEALACIDWQAGPVDPIRAAGFLQPGAQGEAVAVWQSLVRCRYFHLDYALKQQPFSLGGDGQMRALMVLYGRGQLYTPVGRDNLVPGDTLILAAALSEVLVSPHGVLGLLVCTLPGASSAA
jgi:mannose-6-phosphate isomerase